MAGAEETLLSCQRLQLWLLAAMWLFASAAEAQLVAFPGAEGAGKFATGGRHFGAAVANTLDIGALLAKLANQIGSVKVATGFAG